MIETTSQNYEQRIGEKLIVSYRFWHKRRLWFNALVGVAGIAGLLTSKWPLFMGIPIMLFVAVWALLANGLYSLGYSIESSLVMQSKGFNDYGRLRHILFWTGTLLYALVSFLVAYTVLKELNEIPF